MSPSPLVGEGLGRGGSNRRCDHIDHPLSPALSHGGKGSHPGPFHRFWAARCAMDD